MQTYRLNYKEKKPAKIFIIIVIILLLLFFLKPLTWLRKTLYIKSMEYKSTHDPVYFSGLTTDNQNLPMPGKIITSFSTSHKGIDIKPTTDPTEVRIIEVGMVVDIGYNEYAKNYVKVRHVVQNSKEIFYSYYSNLPNKITLHTNEWVGSSTILYSGSNLDYLHLEVTDFDGNQLDPSPYINIE